jgi:hypothetical protein
VDLVINGHEHEYERSFPLHAGSPPDGAPVIQTGAGSGTTYVICAGAGAQPYPVAQSPAPYSMIQVPFGSASASVKYIGVYALLTMRGNTLTLMAYGLKASSSTVAGDDVIDTVSLSH